MRITNRRSQTGIPVPEKSAVSKYFHGKSTQEVLHQTYPRIRGCPQRRRTGSGVRSLRGSGRPDQDRGRRKNGEDEEKGVELSIEMEGFYVASYRTSEAFG